MGGGGGGAHGGGASAASTPSLLMSVCPEINDPNDPHLGQEHHPDADPNAAVNLRKQARFRGNATAAAMRDAIFALVAQAVQKNAASLRFASMCDVLRLGASEEARIVEVSAGQWVAALRLAAAAAAQQQPQPQQQAAATTSLGAGAKRPATSGVGGGGGGGGRGRGAAGAQAAGGGQLPAQQTENIVVVPWYTRGMASQLLDPEKVQRIIDEAE